MKNYYLALRNLESEVLDELYDLLRRKGAISIDDNRYEFFNFGFIERLEIYEIDQLGIITTGHCKGSSIRQVIDNNTLQLVDLISLVDELREVCKKLSI